MESTVGRADSDGIVNATRKATCSVLVNECRVCTLALNNQIVSNVDLVCGYA